MRTRYYMTTEVKTEQGIRLHRTPVDLRCYQAWRTAASDIWYDYMPQDLDVVAVIDVEKVAQ